MIKFVEKLREVRASIVAIGIQNMPNQLSIIGSGFAVNNSGGIFSSAHLFQNLTEGQKEKLMCMTMIERGVVERYRWLPLHIKKQDDSNDAALLQVEGYKETLLKALLLGDPEEIEEGENVYFIGFPYAARLINEGYGITLIANKGILSAVKRKGGVEGNPLDWFIVDAISNPGNSGCPLLLEESNKVIGIMTTAFRTQSQKYPDLDIREPMHIAGAKPINWGKRLLNE